MTCAVLRALSAHHPLRARQLACSPSDCLMRSEQLFGLKARPGLGTGWRIVGLTPSAQWLPSQACQRAQQHWTHTRRACDCQARLTKEPSSTGHVHPVPASAKPGLGKAAGQGMQRLALRQDRPRRHSRGRHRAHRAHTTDLVDGGEADLGTGREGLWVVLRSKTFGGPSSTDTVCGHRRGCTVCGHRRGCTRS